MRAPCLPAALWLAVIACGDPPPPTPDASLDAPRDSASDARACAMPGDCPCFSNYDCPDTHACVSQDPGGEMVSCVEGARGQGAPGTPCTGEADCASALCVDDANGGMRCSDICSSPSTCPPELPRCISLGGEGICVRPLPM
ncbi:MAG: repeat domain protein [Myxococcales bacterium]|nr:repeat domain protein [Myxococcales bacterium]